MKGQTIPQILSIISLIAGIGIPFTYIGGMKTDIALQGEKLRTTDDSVQRLDSNVEYMRRLIEALALKDGVNIEKIKLESQLTNNK